MGTRIVYVLRNADGKTVASFASNDSHPVQNAHETFTQALANAEGPVTATELVLASRYETDGGNHRAGDRIFWMQSVAETFNGDYETMVTATWSGAEGDWTVKVAPRLRRIGTTALFVETACQQAPDECGYARVPVMDATIEQIDGLQQLCVEHELKSVEVDAAEVAWNSPSERLAGLAVQNARLVVTPDHFHYASSIDGRTVRTIDITLKTFINAVEDGGPAPVLGSNPEALRNRIEDDATTRLMRATDDDSTPEVN